MPAFRQTHSISATFAINSYTLTIANAGNGNGSVTVNGVAGFGTIEHNYGNRVTLAATVASTSSAFSGWGGDCSSFGAKNPITVTTTAPINCTANFTTVQ